jgi:hypothetical protein
LPNSAFKAGPKSKKILLVEGSSNPILGPVATGMTSGGEMLEATATILVGSTRAGDRVGTVEDIANTILLLASEKGKMDH